MERRRLGSEGLEVSALGLGCMGMSEFYGTDDEADAMATFDRALELGVDFLDTAAQLALAWLLHRGDDVVPIPGTKHVEYLEENVAAVEIELSDEELARVDEIAPEGVAAGDRYADMCTVNR